MTNELYPVKRNWRIKLSIAILIRAAVRIDRGAGE